jgi:excisionase family DNA binding protein
MGQGFEKSGAGAGGVGAEMAVGMAMAQQMVNQAASAAAAPVPVAVPETLSPGEAATLLGVTEADVLASLEKGDLKGKRIGAQWRITRAQVADFLR